MSQFKKFDEYLNSKKTMQDKPKVCIDGDNLDLPPAKAKDDPRKSTPKKPKPVKEYLGPSGKLVEKPKTSTVADYDGPNESKPPKSITSGKGWKALHAEPTGEPDPYKTPVGSKPGGKSETGFGELGDKSLIYKPDTAKAHPPKTQTEQFIEKTKGMSLGEFSNYYMEFKCSAASCEQSTDSDHRQPV